jgi:hypothetical protein
VEAEGTVTQRRTDDPATDLTDSRVGENEDRLAQGNPTLGGTRGHVGNDTLAGQQEGQHHQPENLDQRDGGRSHLQSKRQPGDSRAIEWQ